MDLVEQQYLQVLDSCFEKSSFSDTKHTKKKDGDNQRLASSGKASHNSDAFTDIFKALDAMEAAALDVTSLLFGSPAETELHEHHHDDCHAIVKDSLVARRTHSESGVGDQDSDDDASDTRPTRETSSLRSSPRGPDIPDALTWESLEAAMLPSSLQRSMEEAVMWAFKSKKE